MSSLDSQYELLRSGRSVPNKWSYPVAAVLPWWKSQPLLRIAEKLCGPDGNDLRYSLLWHARRVWCVPSARGRHPASSRAVRQGLPPAAVFSSPHHRYPRARPRFLSGPSSTPTSCVRATYLPLRAKQSDEAGTRSFRSANPE